MDIKLFKKVNPLVIFSNLKNICRYDLKNEIRDTQKEIIKLKNKVKETQIELLYFKILNFFSNNPDNAFEKELEYLKNIGQIDLFPYQKLKALNNISADFDSKKSMPYVLHKEKKLYFPMDLSVDDAKKSYRSLVEEQNILGGGYTEKAPHQYETKNFKVEEGDLVLDIGAAEGLFTLNVIDIAAKIIIFEPDQQWLIPLQATFEPFNSKVKIVNKAISSIDTEHKVRIDTALEEVSIDSIFIKMDIEGDEYKVVEKNRNFFLNCNSAIKIACATYHKRDHAHILQNLFSGMGYNTELSEGYMIYVHDENLTPPYFRKGILRAQRNAMVTIKH